MLSDAFAKRNANNSLATRNAAYAESLKRSRSQRALILEAFEVAGASGLTREEAAAKTVLPLQSVCRPILDLERAGVLVETERKRPTRYGKTAVVLCHRDAFTRGAE